MKYGEVFWTTVYGSDWYRLLRHDLILCNYRQSPVPGSGRSWRYGHHFRHPKTTQERRQSLAYPEYHRGRRNNHNLPTTWDDYSRGNWNNKSWKAQKKRKQWMKHRVSWSE